MNDQISDFPDEGRKDLHRDGVCRVGAEMSGGVEAETRSTPAGGHAVRKSRPGAEIQSLTVSETRSSPAQSPSLTDRGLLLMAIQPQLQPEHIEDNPELGTVLGYFQKKYGPAFFPMPLEKKEADVNAVPPQGQKEI